MGSAQKAILVPARPEALPIDPARTAVVVVDMQNDFGSEGGMFALAGIDLSGIKSIVPIVAKVLAAARQAGILVIYLKMAMRPDLSDVGPPDLAHFQRHKRMQVGEVTKAPDGSPSRILIRDTWNTRRHSGACARAERSRRLQAQIQRLLRNQPRRNPQEPLHKDTDIHRMHDQRLC